MVGEMSLEGAMPRQRADSGDKTRRDWLGTGYGCDLTASAV